MGVSIRTAKPRAKPYKIGCGHGLFLLINPNGSKLWRFKYRFEGREKTLTFGGYPRRFPGFKSLPSNGSKPMRPRGHTARLERFGSISTRTFCQPLGVMLSTASNEAA